MRSLAGLAAAALLGACGMEADFDDTRFSCEASSECPGGQSCIDNQCVPDGSGDEDVQPASCDDASDLRDDFNGRNIDDRVWLPYADGGGNAGQDGDAYFSVGGTAGAAGFMTRCSYDMTDDRVYIYVDEVAGNGAETFFEIVTTDGNYAALDQHGSVLAARTHGGNDNRVESSSHDQSYAWWMIEGDDGEIQYWLAIEEGDWQLITSHPIPDGFQSAHISFGVRAEQPGEPVEARFDDYNGG